MSARETLSLVIVGHVDHGKSTLIGRLLYDTHSLAAEKMEEIRKASSELGHDVEFAYVMDHLREERTDAMTIDTAQAFFKTDKRDYVIIDAPGHKELTKNMITGASQAEAAILVVDAVEGLQEQTKRHAYFIAMLGIGQISILINKMDKVDYSEERFRRVADDVERFLESVGAKPGLVIPGSAMKGDNIAGPSDKMVWHRGDTVLGVLDAFKPTASMSDKVLRFPVQDIYSVDGKRIFVGRIESGRITKGQDLSFVPSGASARVAGVEVFGEERVSADAGECIGITLEPRLEPERGEIGCPVGQAPEPTGRFRANVFWMAEEPCRTGETIAVRAATQEIACKVDRIEKRIDSSTLAVLEEDAAELGDTEVGQMILSAERPIVLEAFEDVPELGRIVIARGFDVVGGGLVTHAGDAHLGTEP